MLVCLFVFWFDYLSLQIVVNTFPKNALVFIVVLNRTIKVCYTLISRYFMEGHAVSGYNFVYQSEFSFGRPCYLFSVSRRVNVNFNNCNHVMFQSGLLPQQCDGDTEDCIRFPILWKSLGLRVYFILFYLKKSYLETEFKLNNKRYKCMTWGYSPTFVIYEKFIS